MDKQLRKRLVHSTTWYACTGSDDAGDKTFAAGVSIPCYIDGSTKMVRNLDGEEVVSIARLYMEGEYTFTEKDEFVYHNKRFPVISFPEYPSLTSGIELVEVIL